MSQITEYFPTIQLYDLESRRLPYTKELVDW